MAGKKPFAAAAALLGALSLSSAAAQPSSANPGILSVNRSLSLGYELYGLNYGEPDDGSQIQLVGGQTIFPYYADTETGYFNGFDASLSWMQDWGPVDNLYARLDYDWAQGRAQYVGYAGAPFLAGSFTPVKEPDPQTVQEFSGRLGKGFAFGGEALWTPYAALGRRRWNRGTDSEIYGNLFLALGQMIQYSPWSDWVFTADGWIGKTFDSQIQVPGTDLNPAWLGSSPIFRLGLETDYKIYSHVHAFAAWSYEYLTYGPSGVSAQGYIEPFSRTEIIRWRLGLRLCH